MELQWTFQNPSCTAVPYSACSRDGMLKLWWCWTMHCKPCSFLHPLRYIYLNTEKYGLNQHAYQNKTNHIHCWLQSLLRSAAISLQKFLWIYSSSRLSKNWNTSSILCRPLSLSLVEILTRIKERDLYHLNGLGLVFACETVSAVNSCTDFYLCSFSHLLAGCTLLDMNTGSCPLCFCRWNCKVLGTHYIHSDLEEAKPDTSVLVTKICDNDFQNAQEISAGNQNPQSILMNDIFFSHFSKSLYFLLQVIS